MIQSAILFDNAIKLWYYQRSSKPAITCSKLIIEALGQDAKYIQSQQ